MANEVQFWLTNKPDDICPTHYIAERAIPFDDGEERFAPIFLRSSRDDVIASRIYRRKKGEEPAEKMHAHPGIKGNLRPSIVK